MRHAVILLAFLTLLSVPGALLPAPVAGATASEDLLEVNTATAEQLRALPEIGDAYSERIIKGRPYASKDELVHKKILPRAIYEQIKYKIVAKQK
jgi:DNA uptake protein ComE-like DNA-binding protein